MRVAVVGATGLLGRALVPLLLEHDHVVLALARSPAKASEVLPPKADILPGDLQSATAGSVFNIVAEPIRYGEYLDRLADALGIPHPPRESNLPTPPSWRCSNELARSVLGWNPKHSIIPTI
jgi:nucleoside-diphosphate-sugar epimerase